MSLWRQLRRGLAVLVRPSAANRDLDDESRDYFERLSASLEVQGLPPAEARRAARLEMGTALGIREQVRDAGWESWLPGLADDCRYATRRLARAPGFTAAAILTLALGIGAAAAIFTVTDSVLLKPLPYPEAGRLVALWHTAPGVNAKDLRMAPSLYFTYREEGRVFEDLAMWNGNRATVTGLGAPEEVPTLFVTHSFLDVLRVQPALGRGFLPSDDDPQQGRVVLLSNAYWKDRFAGSAAALGRSILVDGNPHEVIGVLPASFTFLDEKVSLVVPTRLRRSEVGLIQFSYDGIARLEPAVTLAQANADAARCLALAPAKFAANNPFATAAFRDARIAPALRPLKEHLIGNTGATLWILVGAAGILLLIACANVANLLLVRADARQHELAVREALGARRRHILRDLLMESLLLSVAGGGLALALSSLAIEWLADAAASNLPRLEEISMGARTFAFVFGASIAAGVLFALLAVAKHARSRVQPSWSARSMTQSRDRSRGQRALLVFQVTLATVLMVGAGLMFKTRQNLRSVDPGFSRPENVQLVRVSIPVTQAPEPERVLSMEEAILSRFQSVAGVSAVAITTAPPLEGGAGDPIYSADRDSDSRSLPPVRHMRSVSPGIIAASGSRLIAGREFTWQELHNGPTPALISENLARELWGDPRAALGKRIRSWPAQNWREVVGVVADLHDDGVTRPAPAIVYWPLALRTPAGALAVERKIDFVIRSPRAGSAAFIRELQRALESVNPNLPLANVRTLGAVYEKSMARSSFTLMLLALSGAMALSLGIVGIYGAMSYSIARRRREIGIRIALGSSTRAVTVRYVRQGLILAAAGSSLGLLVSLGATRLMQSLLFGVSAVDVATYGAAFGLTLIAALSASWLPARKAAALDPIQTLRAD